MGIGPGYKYRGCSSSPYSVPGSNPKPSNFQILDSQFFRGRHGKTYLLVKVRYPDATNYEGVKILVYEGFCSLAELLQRTNNRLDPHFADVGVSPIARFEPTAKGWDMATKFVRSL